MMKKKNTPLVVGNWKMNPATLSLAKKIFTEIRNGLSGNKGKVDVAIAPPFPFISELERLSSSKRIALAAQDVFPEPAGTFTGEVSLSMLKSVGVTYAIIGHSERRALGDTDEEINKDTQATIKSGITAIVCVGERKRDSHGNYFTFVEKQIRDAVHGVPKTKLSHLAIAYEPVWAISSGDGKGRTATPEDIVEMKLFILKVLSDVFGRSASERIRVLYGGSVNKKNAQEILEKSEVDGFLVGGASLRAADFIAISKIAATL